MRRNRPPEARRCDDAISITAQNRRSRAAVPVTQCCSIVVRNNLFCVPAASAPCRGIWRSSNARYDLFPCLRGILSESRLISGGSCAYRGGLAPAEAPSGRRTRSVRRVVPTSPAAWYSPCHGGPENEHEWLQILAHECAWGMISPTQCCSASSMLRTYPVFVCLRVPEGHAPNALSYLERHA